MEREQIIKDLECCANEWYCGLCEFTKKECALIKKNALALINSQEQRIGAQDMTISEFRQRCDKAKHDASRYKKRIKELTAKVAKWEEECDLRGDMWCKLNEESKRLAEENERLRAENEKLAHSCTELTHNLHTVQADTVKQFAERLKADLKKNYPQRCGDCFKERVDQIKKEMLKEE